MLVNLTSFISLTAVIANENMKGPNILQVVCDSTLVLSFFMYVQTAPLPHGLDKIPDVQGYLVINSDGAVLAVSVKLIDQMAFHDY